VTRDTGAAPPGPCVQDDFDVRRVVVSPGVERLFVEAEWRDAIVVVESGGLELESRTGVRWRFARGDVLWLIGLPLRALHAYGQTPTVLIAASRSGKRHSQRSAV
jgi:hypothetical protein